MKVKFIATKGVGLQLQVRGEKEQFTIDSILIDTMNKKDVLLFNYENKSNENYTKFDHTGDFTHFRSSLFSLQVVKTHLI